MFTITFPVKPMRGVDEAVEHEDEINIIKSQIAGNNILVALDVN